MNIPFIFNVLTNFFGSFILQFYTAGLVYDERFSSADCDAVVGGYGGRSASKAFDVLGLA